MSLTIHFDKNNSVFLYWNDLYIDEQDLIRVLLMGKHQTESLM